MDALTLEQVANGSYDILLADDEIGYIEANDGFLTQIEVFPEHRGNGYGTEAVKQFLTIQRQRGASHVETSTVVSSEMESIVEQLGFHRVESEPSHWRIEF